MGRWSDLLTVRQRADYSSLNLDFDERTESAIADVSRLALNARYEALNATLASLPSDLRESFLAGLEQYVAGELAQIAPPPEG